MLCESLRFHKAGTRQPVIPANAGTTGAFTTEDTERTIYVTCRSKRTLKTGQFLTTEDTEEHMEKTLCESLCSLWFHNFVTALHNGMTLTRFLANDGCEIRNGIPESGQKRLFGDIGANC